MCEQTMEESKAKTNRLANQRSWIDHIRWTLSLMTHVPHGAIGLSKYYRVQQQQHKRTWHIILPTILIKNNKSIRLKSDLEL
jgi:hypothetical protein